MWTCSQSFAAHSSYAAPRLSNPCERCGETALLSGVVQTANIAPPTRGLLCAQLLARIFDLLPEGPIARHLALHLVHTVDDRGMVAAAEGLSDLDQLHLQQVPGEVHGDLARHRERLD